MVSRMVDAISKHLAFYPPPPCYELLEVDGRQQLRPCVPRGVSAEEWERDVP